MKKLTVMTYSTVDSFFAKMSHFYDSIDIYFGSPNALKPHHIEMALETQRLFNASDKSVAGFLRKRVKNLKPLRYSRIQDGSLRVFIRDPLSCGASGKKISPESHQKRYLLESEHGVKRFWSGSANFGPALDWEEDAHVYGDDDPRFYQILDDFDRVKNMKHFMNHQLMPDEIQDIWDSATKQGAEGKDEDDEHTEEPTWASALIILRDAIEKRIPEEEQPKFFDDLDELEIALRGES